MEKKLYDLMDWAAIEAIVYSEEEHPEEILGAHKVRGGVLIQVFFPGAETVLVKKDTDGRLYPMEEADEEGFYAVLISARKLFSYSLLVKYADGTEKQVRDPYLYQNIWTEESFLEYSDGSAKKIYQKLGAHRTAVDGVGEEARLLKPDKSAGKKKQEVITGTRFAVWAPNAMRVSVVGEFNHWDGRVHPMIRQGDTGVFALFLPDVEEGAAYKYEIKYRPNEVNLKSDPFGFGVERGAENASVVTELEGFAWKDKAWLEKRKKFDYQKEPFSVYEVNLGSFMDDAKTTYRKLAPKLAEYVLDMGYTHVELLPVTEAAADDELGYRVNNFYSVSSKYGSPKDFMYLVNYLHGKGIGVLLDWIPSGFSMDESGLKLFDGKPLYGRYNVLGEEDANGDTFFFDYKKPQVCNFLIANAVYWKEVYHIDGLRVCGVAPMLYLDYGKTGGGWLPNEFGGKENLEAIQMIRKLNEVFHAFGDGAVLIAEESTSFPMVTGDEKDSLGFDMKWNLGWLHDFLAYMRIDPYFRKGSHDKLVFSMIYAYSERFLLPISHDVTGEEGMDLFRQMPGDDDQKEANVRAFIGFMMTHPGKKLFSFRGEFLNAYIKEWNEFYKKHPALFRMDYEPDGFEWISNLDADHSIIAFLRKAEKETLLVVCNFTPVIYENFKVGVPGENKYKEIFNSDKKEFGGMGTVNRKQVSAKPMPWDGREYSVAVNVPPMGVSVFECL